MLGLHASKHFAILLNVIILVVSFFFFWDSILWIRGKLIFGVNPLNLIAFLGIFVLFLFKLKGWFYSIVKIQERPILPILSMFLALVCYIYIDYLYGIETFKSVFFLFFLFGFVGLWVRRKDWLSASLPVLLLLILLPFGSLLDTYVGFPLRMGTATLVSTLLEKWGLMATDSQTILGLENNYTQVDATCSGINVLWAGTLLFIAYSIIYRLKINGKWLISYVLLIGLLLLFNAFRITVLILLDLVFNASSLANFIHQPLGIIGFIIPVLLIWYLLNRGHSNTSISPNTMTEHRIIQPKWYWQATFIPIMLLLYGFANKGSIDQPLTIDISPNYNLNFDTLPLTGKERAYFQFENAVAQKYKIDYLSIKGSMIVVSTNSFKGHHNPELCLQSIGLKIDENKPVLIGDKPARLLKFKGNKLAGLFWFKNKDLYTDDYSYRVWHDIKAGNRNNNWVQVTALFSNEYKEQDLNQFYNKINQELNENN
jgi:exosortase O